MSENENAESVPEEKEEKIEIKNIPEPEHSFSALEEALDYVNNTDNLEAVFYVNEDNIITSKGFSSYE